MAPYESTIKTAQPYAQETYDITHSGYYSSAENIAAKVKEYSAKVAEIPVIGTMAQTAQVQQYADAAISLFENARNSSEVVLVLIGWTLALIGLAAPGFLFSVLMIIIGVWIYKKEGGMSCCEGKTAATGKKR
ncbi:MAG: hypothetical protein NT051_03090 [Candidatus Micrarchaeota archaeon]|nr:hypothetical protein [Candidatus Micrarchaeota archaeon]